MDSGNKCAWRHLAEVLEDNGDVHVDDDKKRHDEVGDEVSDRQPGVAAVAVWTVQSLRVVTVGRRIVHQAGQHAVPPSRRTRLFTTHSSRTTVSFRHHNRLFSFLHEAFTAVSKLTVLPQTPARVPSRREGQ